MQQKKTIIVLIFLINRSRRKHCLVKKQTKKTRKIIYLN